VEELVRPFLSSCGSRRSVGRSSSHFPFPPSSGHPTCLQMSSKRLVAMVMSYDWRCIECKPCEICKQKGDDVSSLQTREGDGNVELELTFGFLPPSSASRRPTGEDPLLRQVRSWNSLRLLRSCEFNLSSTHLFESTAADFESLLPQPLTQPPDGELASFRSLRPSRS